MKDPFLGRLTNTLTRRCIPEIAPSPNQPHISKFPKLEFFLFFDIQRKPDNKECEMLWRSLVFLQSIKILLRMDRTLKNKLRPHDLDPLLGFQPWQVHHHPGVQGLQLKLHFLVFQAVVTILPHSLGTRIEILKSLRIGFVFCMLQHLVPEKVV